MKKPKFNIVDYIIIIVVIVAIAFAFIHISTESNHEVQSSTYDYSSIGKIINKYLGYYLNGNYVNSTVVGIEANTGKEVKITGQLVWAGDDSNNKFVGKLVTSNGTSYLLGIYSDVPYADIFINQITLESDGSKYNATDITIKPMNITSLNDLSPNINSSYEISTRVTSNSLDSEKYQLIFNQLIENNEVPIKFSTTTNQITLNRLTGENLNSIGTLADVTGTTSEITIRIYNCTDSDLEYVQSNFDVVNVKTL